MQKVKKIGKILLVSLAILAGLLAVAFFLFHEPLPKGEAGEPAERLARKMLKAVNETAWDSTRVLSWTFAGRHSYLWDKDRNRAQIRWGDKRVLMDLDDQSGRAWTDGRELSGEEKTKTLEKAWAFWCNDAFWFNPVVKCYDPGTTRKLVRLEKGEEALLVTYTSGGVTPGDSYLWILDDEGLPKSWKLWVSIIPIGGLEFSWEGWRELSTGVLVSTLHKSKFINLEITDVKGSMSFREHGLAEDPFSLLEEEE